MGSLKKIKPVSNDVLMDRELVRRRIVEAALWNERPAPNKEFQTQREPITRRFQALMEEFQQNNPREFIVSLRQHRRGYSPQLDGPSSVMRLVDSIDELASLEVQWLLAQQQKETEDVPKDPSPQ